MRTVVLTATAALATQLFGCGSATQTHPVRSLPTAHLATDAVMRRLVVRDPPTFLDVEYTDTGSPRAIDLRSPVHGKVVKMLAGPAPVDYQGGAMSLDGRYAYVARSAGRIDRITLAYGATQRVAEGQNPAISPDGRLLAYNTGRHGSTPTILALSTGVTRAVDLAGLGAGPDDSITWLGIVGRSSSHRSRPSITRTQRETAATAEDRSPAWSSSTLPPAPPRAGLSSQASRAWSFRSPALTHARTRCCSPGDSLAGAARSLEA